MRKINLLIENVFKKEADIFSCLSSFFCFLVLRCFCEQYVALSSPLSPQEVLVEFIHNLFFFGISFLLIWILTSHFLKMNPARLSYLFSWAFSFMLFPPLIDMLYTKGEVFWSFYLLGDIRTLFWEYVTIFGNLPSGIVYFGTKITFLVAIFLLSVLAYFKTKKIWRAVFLAVSSYSILFFMGAFPSFVTYLGYFILKKPLSSVSEVTIVQFVGNSLKTFGVEFSSFKYLFAYHLDFFYFPFLLFLLGFIFWKISREKFVSVMKNARYPQLVYHAGLFFVGMGLGFLRYPENFQLNFVSFFAVLTLLLSVFLAWLASVVPNDIYDVEIDRLTNPDRPLPSGKVEKEEYIQIGVLFFLLSLLGGAVLSGWFFVLLLVYQVLAWLYSSPPMRLKKFPGIATFVSALASLTVLFLGYTLLSENQSIHSLSWRIIVLLLVSYTLCLPIKDFKDIEGDGKYGVLTVPVIFGEKRGRLVVAISIFFSYILSVFLLNELKLFFWALFFGILSYLVMNSRKIKPKNIYSWILGLVAVYGLILVKIVFF